MSYTEASCLCGAVTIKAENVNPKFTVCHCQSCRKWGGAPYFAVKCGTQVKIEGGDKVKMYQSSSWASRGFCTECGLIFSTNLKQPVITICH
ncbi:Glutathione-dependent formaldehyde-activating enzyme [Vibrio thalassae]|uniref:Glutathione-dependent formaldehyde-activating enzyme n=1 Tax=Vibrio thalassae TaxID=1243014 RepID=A0A240EPZ4_9VIBR|nr:Glutathione-dependent formaldehyde-activating enzyme [Vibrio thalassae]